MIVPDLVENILGVINCATLTPVDTTLLAGIIETILRASR